MKGRNLGLDVPPATSGSVPPGPWVFQLSSNVLPPGRRPQTARWGGRAAAPRFPVAHAVTCPFASLPDPGLCALLVTVTGVH